MTTARDAAIIAALVAHDGMERLIREEGMPREAVEPEPVGFLAALEGLGFTVSALDGTPEPHVHAWHPHFTPWSTKADDFEWCHTCGATRVSVDREEKPRG